MAKVIGESGETETIFTADYADFTDFFLSA